MLVLSRRTGEQIVIGDNVRINVLEMSGSKVRLGITAPTEVPVHRLEVHQRIHDEQTGIPRGEEEAGVDSPAGVLETKKASNMCAFVKSRVLAEFRNRARHGLSLVQIGDMLVDVVIQAGMNLRREPSLEEVKDLLAQILRTHASLAQNQGLKSPLPMPAS